MKKFHAVFLALFAVLAFGAVIASSASAETTLAAQWLHNGAAVTTTLEGETAGSLLLEDTGAKATLLCSAIVDGEFLANGEFEVLKVLNSNGEEIVLGGLSLSIAGGNCTNVSGCGAPAEVWPEGLPWKGHLFLKESGAFAESITGSGTGGSFGYTSLCTVLIDVEDTCTSTSGTIPVENDLEDAAIPSGAILTPNANCTVGGSGTGKNESDELALLKLNNAELLTASE